MIYNILFLAFSFIIAYNQQTDNSREILNFSLGDLTKAARNDQNQPSKVKTGLIITKSSEVNDFIHPSLLSFGSQLSSENNPQWLKYHSSSGYTHYQAATKAFSSFSALKEVCCQGCNVIRLVAFRQYSTQFYLQAGNNNLVLSSSKSPSNQQLFTAIQNMDCTWSFKSSKDTYISLNFEFNDLSLKNNLGLGQRFYMQRKDQWIYIQSANVYRYFWMTRGNLVGYGLNEAARWVMQIWPTTKNGWN